MKVLVGSENPVKIAATQEAFACYFDGIKVLGIKIDSSVSEQPINDEVFTGARNRARTLRNINQKKRLEGNFFVGIEGGIMQLESKWFAFGGICILDKEGREGYGTSPFFELPPKITKHLLRGMELGNVMDNLTGDTNTKQKQGAVGYFTKGVLKRKDYYLNGLLMALIPFLHRDFYFKNKCSGEVEEKRARKK